MSPHPWVVVTTAVFQLLPHRLLQTTLRCPDLLGWGGSNSSPGNFECSFWPSLTIHHWERMPLTPVTPLFYLKRRADVITWLKFPVSLLTGAFFCTRSEETRCESITITTVTSAAQARLTQVSFWWASMKSRCVAVRYSVPVDDLLLVLNRSSNFTCSTWKRESIISHYKVI